jgi:GWxTD domain-containing protein
MMADTALGWTLVHFLWQGTAGAVVLSLVLAVTRSPRVRYAAGCLMLAMMALATLVTYGILRQPGMARELGPLTLALGAGDGLARAVAGAEPISWVAWLPLFWLVGVAVLSARLILAALGVRRLTHRGATEIPDTWRHLRERLGIERAVTFLASPFVTGPAQAGFLKPVILLPASLLTQLPAAQLEAIVAHELAHVQRHDYLVNLLQTVMETLLFYHPAVWWISHVVRVEREHCCDLAAAEATGNTRQYAEALLAVELLAGGRIAFTNAATGGDLRQRIARLLGKADRPVNIGLPAILLAALLVALMAFPVVRSQAQTNPPALSKGETESFAHAVDRWHRSFVLYLGLPLLHSRHSAPKALAQTAAPVNYDRWLHEDVVYIISAPEVERFQKLKSDAEREQFIEQFWKRRDTNPATAENEAKLEHYRRIAYANKRFRVLNTDGWKTERGRVYIVKGPPDEIESHPERGNDQWLYRSPREIFKFKR